MSLKQLKYSAADIFRFCVDSEEVSGTDKFAKIPEANMPEFHANQFTLVENENGAEEIMAVEIEGKVYAVTAYKAKKGDIGHAIDVEVDGKIVPEMRLCISAEFVETIQNSKFWVVKEKTEKGTGVGRSGKEEYVKLLGESARPKVDALYALLNEFNEQVKAKGYRFNVYVRYPKAATE